MILESAKGRLSGEVAIPASKSHTIRALAFATLARGQSAIANPLRSADTSACVDVCRALGAVIDDSRDTWTVTGTAGRIQSAAAEVDVLNSGTTLYIVLSMAALGAGRTVFTGDAQIQRRSAQPLLDALNALGASAESLKGNGCAPIAVSGPMKGGTVSLACPTSQYLTSLLISAPLAEGDTEIIVTELNEAPYVCMTLDWLNMLDVEYSQERMRRFHVPGGQRYKCFSERMRGDFSSATFFLCAAAVTGADIVLRGLDINDSQGDKAVVDMLKRMGARIDALPAGLRIRGGALKGVEIDLNATPDALPAMAITGCFAEGETRLVNVPQARMKETDRIAVMREVIHALGGEAEELPDGLVVKGKGLRGGSAPGHADHRVVMACGLAGLAADAPVRVDTAEAMAVTFPSYVELMNALGAPMRMVE